MFKGLDNVTRFSDICTLVKDGYCKILQWHKDDMGQDIAELNIDGTVCFYIVLGKPEVILIDEFNH